MDIKSIRIEKKTITKIFKYLKKQLGDASFAEAIDFCEQQDLRLTQDENDDFKIGLSNAEVEKIFYKRDMEGVRDIPIKDILKQIEKHLNIEQESSELKIKYVGYVLSVTPTYVYFIEVYNDADYYFKVIRRVNIINYAYGDMTIHKINFIQEVMTEIKEQILKEIKG